MTVRLNQGHSDAAGDAPGGVYRAAAAPTRRDLLLHDTVLLAVLIGVAVALFGVTLFLFKSFESHREELGKRWSDRGRLALRQGHPDQAADALRIALSYHPENRTDQLLLAQALANSGHTEAATNYFLSLWDATPGDGFVNLQLARLARKRGDAAEAINYYRASIFGDWRGNGATMRRGVRLELADYLAQRGQTAAAKVELLIAAGNAPEKESGLQIEIADRLAALGDLQDALHFYQVAVAGEAHNEVALEKAGRAAYALAEYKEAARLLGEAAEVARRKPHQERQAAQLASIAEQARRAPELSLARDLPADVRAKHIMEAAGIAQARLRGCLVHPEAASSNNVPAVQAMTILQVLKARWTDEAHSLRPTVLQRDSALDDSITQLVNDTEVQTAKICGEPTGDDAVLLMLGSRAGGTQ